jgi:hypothetical protein
MHDALLAMGHVDVYEIEPRGYREQLRRFAEGSAECIGSEDDPFVLMASSKPIARYYIRAMRDRCVVVLTGSAKFMSALDRLEPMPLRDASTTLH